MSQPLARLTAECLTALAVCWGTAAGLIALGHRINHPKGGTVELTIPTPHGSVVVEAKPTETHGLVTHPVLFFDDQSTRHVIADLDWRSVTHMPSGMRFAVNFPDDQHAADFANSIGHLADWQQATPDIPEVEVLEVAFQYGGVPDDIYHLGAYQSERTAAVEVRKAGE